MTKLKVLDLFAGIGGFSLGLERTGGFETVAFCEIDKPAQKVLRKHWKDVPIFEDVKTLKGEDVGTIDVITGGFPCQDISVAGKGAGLEGTRSGLWWEYHRIIKETQPKWVIAENVSALRSRGLDQVLRSLSEIGYDAEWHCIPASAIGAPHRRDRIWIVAYPMYSQCNARTEEQRTLREMSSDSSINHNISGRSETYSITISNTDSSLETDDLANSTSIGLQRSWKFKQSEHSAPIVSWKTIESEYGRISDFWKIEPNVGRVADGVPGRVDRLKQLGNAVVPQIPELIGRAILMKENKL